MRRWLKHKSVQSFMQLLGGNVLTSLSQGIQFFMLARALGPAEFGRIAAVNGVTQLLMPFAGFGAPSVMVMRSSRDPALLPLYFGNALLVMLASAALLVLLAVFGITPMLNGQVSFSLMAVFAVSELFASKVVDICWQVFIARDQVRQTSTLLTMQSVSRLLAAGIFISMTKQPDAAQWSWFALTSNVLVSALVLRMTVREVGSLRFDMLLARRELGAGASFAIGQSARSFYTDADKLFLARYAGAAVVGHYTMAFRVVMIALTVIRALSLAMQTKLYRAGQAGIAGTFSVTKRVMRPTVPMALFLAAAFWLTAPLLPWIAGARYEPSVDVLRALCFMPLILVLQVLLCDTLATSGYQRVVALSQLVSAALICVLSLVLIPRIGWSGAVIASYFAQGVLCLLMFLSIRSLLREASATKAPSDALAAQLTPPGTNAEP